MAYQTFDDQKGDSRSQEKLAKIGLPTRLEGKSVLDLGCNEGFFCIEAKHRGARHVVGVDRNSAAIAAAANRSNRAGLDVTFLTLDLEENIPNERFDFVLLLSTLHYIQRPALFLRRISPLLTKSGLLILETGVVGNLPGCTVGRALRSIDERFFPTTEMLVRGWLRDFAVRRFGASVDQVGDPFRRYVFHCSPLSTNVLFIVGDGGIGKSSLASQLGAVPIVATDELFNPARFHSPKLHSAQRVYDELTRSTGSIWASWDRMKDFPGVREYFVNVIADAVRSCTGAGLVVVEGFVATLLVAEVQTNLGDDYLCWQTTRFKPFQLNG